MLHMSSVINERASPGDGLFRTRAWIEPLNGKNSLPEIKSVTYHIWDDFPKPIIITSGQSSIFDLWFQTCGDFTLMVVLEKRVAISAS